MALFGSGRLWDLLEPGAAALGFELVAVEHTGVAGEAVLRVYIDGPQGVTLEDCAAVSHQLSGILDVEDPIDGGYTLEVSSPGADRPLVRPEHFARFAGAQVRLWMRHPMAGRRRFKGRLMASSAEGIVLETNGVAQKLGFENIEMARIVPAWRAGGDRNE